MRSDHPAFPLIPSCKEHWLDPVPSSEKLMQNRNQALLEGLSSAEGGQQQVL